MNGLDYDVYMITELPEVQLDTETGEARINFRINDRKAVTIKMSVRLLSDFRRGIIEQLKLWGQSHPEDILPSKVRNEETD